MKKTIMILVLGALVACLVPMTVWAQDWQTNTMQGSGSSYSSSVTPVGATNVDQQAYTTEGNNTPNRISGRRNFEEFDPINHSTESPIGDAVLPLLLMAMGYAVYSVARVYRRRRVLS